VMLECATASTLGVPGTSVTATGPGGAKQGSDGASA
jgi:hypothetical protein